MHSLIGYRGEGFKFKNRDGNLDFADPREVEIIGFGTHMDVNKKEKMKSEMKLRKVKMELN